MKTKTQFLNKLIKLIAPQDMCASEYILQCAVRNVTVSLDDPVYMHWVFTNAYNDFSSKLCLEVRKLLIDGLKNHYICDFSKDIDCNYFNDFLVDVLLKEPITKQETKKLFDVILLEYNGTKLWKFAYRLNRVFGLTTTCYFNTNVDY